MSLFTLFFFLGSLLSSPTEHLSLQVCQYLVLVWTGWTLIFSDGDKIFVLHTVSWNRIGDNWITWVCRHHLTWVVYVHVGSNGGLSRLDHCLNDLRILAGAPLTGLIKLLIYYSFTVVSVALYLVCFLSFFFFLSIIKYKIVIMKSCQYFPSSFLNEIL